MLVTIRFRDLLRDALADIARRFPRHEVAGFAERITGSDILDTTEGGVWATGGDVGWEFTLRKEADDAPGPSAVTVTLDPLADIAFAGTETPESCLLAYAPGEERYVEVCDCDGARNLEIRVEAALGDGRVQ